MEIGNGREGGREREREREEGRRHRSKKRSEETNLRAYNLAGFGENSKKQFRALPHHFKTVDI